MHDSRFWRNVRRARIAAGVALACVAGVAVWLGWRALGEPGARAAPTGPTEAVSAAAATEQLWRHATERPRLAALAMETPCSTGVGDPIFWRRGEGDFVQVGEIRAAEGGPKPAPGAARPTRGAIVARSAEALFYPLAPEPLAGAELVYYHAPYNAEWVMRTMFPPEKRQLLAAEIRAAFEAHHAEIFAALQPIVETSVRESLQILEEDLIAALKARKEKLVALGGKHQQAIVEQEIVPLVKAEIWPIVRQHGEPLATQIGQEIWQRASLWRFGWRMAYDKTFGPKKRLVTQEWERFLKAEAVPVLESHTDDFIALQQQIFTDVARNAEVRAAVKKSLTQIVEDPELRQIVWELVQETIVNNPKLRAALKARWTTPEARQVFFFAADKLEPTVTRVSQLLFGSPETGFSREFALVLRNRVLQKDQRWYVLRLAADGPRDPPPEGQAGPVGEANGQAGPAWPGPRLRVVRGEGFPENPFLPKEPLDRP